MNGTAAAQAAAAPVARDHARTMAEFGSARLCRAMRCEFTAFEARHGLRPGEGQVLLMDTGIRMA